MRKPTSKVVNSPTWTDNEVKFIMENYSTMSNSDLAEVLGKPVKIIMNYGYRHKLKKEIGFKRWSKRDLEILQDRFNTIHIDELCEMLNRPKDSVIRKASSLGLTATIAYKKRKSGYNSTIDSRHADDRELIQLRDAIVRYIALNGPKSIYDLTDEFPQLNNLDVYSYVVNHPWFEYAGGVYSISNIARALVLGK